MLSAHGADVNAQRGFYGNALQAALHNGHAKTVQILVDNGADVNATGAGDGSELRATQWKGQERVVQMLLGADALV